MLVVDYRTVKTEGSNGLMEQSLAVCCVMKVTLFAVTLGGFTKILVFRAAVDKFLFALTVTL